MPAKAGGGVDWINPHDPIYMHVRMYVCMYVYVNAYMYIYIYINMKILFQRPWYRSHAEFYHQRQGTITRTVGVF